MTRSLVVLVLLSLLLPAAAHAESDLRLIAYLNQTANRSPFEASGEFVVVNDGPDVSGPTRVRITLPAPLRFGGLTSFAPSFTCADEGSSVLCVGPSLAKEQGDSESFVLRADSLAAGTHTIEFAIESETDPNLANNRVNFPLSVYRSWDVTTDADSGPGSLREAIERANAVCHDGIDCRISGPSGGDLVIHLQSPLPVITACNLFLSSGSYSIYDNHRAIELDGSALKSGNGFEVRTACGAGQRGVYITGFAIGGFPENGILLATQDETPFVGLGGTSHAVTESVIGVDRLGVEPRPNGLRGIAIESPRTLAYIAQNDIAGNLRSGVAVWAAAPGTTITRNHIGWSRWAAPVVNGNGASGIYIGTDDVFVNSNNIAFNAHFGIGIARGVQRPGVGYNVIHSNGEPAIDWGLDRRTPNDLDESDGIPNAPVITGVHPTTGRLSGFVRSRTGVFGPRFRVLFYVNGGPGLTGRFEAFQFADSVDLQPNADGVFEVPFETRELPHYLHRGYTMAAQLIVTDANGNALWSSELSEPFTVP